MSAIWVCLGLLDHFSLMFKLLWVGSGEKLSQYLHSFGFFFSLLVWIWGLQTGQQIEWMTQQPSLKNCSPHRKRKSFNHTWIHWTANLSHCTMCILGAMFIFQPNKLRHILKLRLDKLFNIYLSLLVQLEGKHDFQGNRDFQTLNLGFPGHFDRFWVFQK